MANVIKHKRGSGSDPGASDLILGELAIRTDTGKLFTKMDSGAIAEIAGGGSDIAINTLSSSSATGGGSATFNGSAYRFTLSAPPSVSAQQLLVSINGVIQKPVAGTGQPSEGFSVDGTDIILGDAPATGSDFFILTFKSLGVSEPADNSVTSAKIVDGAIVNADINASAAIAGTKISPDFGSQNITTTGIVKIADGSVSAPALAFTDDLDTGIFSVAQNTINFTTQGVERLEIGTSLTVFNDGGADVDFRIEGSGQANLFKVDAGNDRVGIGTSSPETLQHNRVNTFSDDINKVALTLSNLQSSGVHQYFQNGSTGTGVSNGARIGLGNTDNFLIQQFEAKDIQISTNSTERMRIDSSGNVGIGTGSPSTLLHLNKTSGDCDLQVQATGTNTDARLNLYGHSGGVSQIRFGDQDDTNVGLLTYDHSTNSMQFRTADAERMRIDSSGRLLIGTTSSKTLDNADCSLQVIGSNFSNSGFTQQRYVNSVSGPSLLFAKSRSGTIGTQTIVQNGDELGKIRFYGSDGNDFDNYAAEIKANVDATPGSNDMPGRLVFLTTSDGAAAPTERMRIGSNGDITVNFDGAGNQTGELLIGDGTESAPGLSFWADGSNDTGIFRPGANTLGFSTGGSERMRIDSSGVVRVGGTASYNSSDKLTLVGTGNTSLTIDATSSTESSVFFADGATGTEAYKGYLQYKHSVDALAIGTSATERIRIDSSGRVGIGTATTNNPDIADGGLQIRPNYTNGAPDVHFTRASSSNTSSVVGFVNGNVGVGSITYNNGGTSFNTSSDYRLKENVVAISDGIARLKTLKPSRFNFIDDETNTLRDGFIAHEVSSIVPEAVTGKKDEVDSDNKPVYQGIDQSKLVPLLVAAVQELTAKVEALEAK